MNISFKIFYIPFRLGSIIWNTRHCLILECFFSIWSTYYNLCTLLQIQAKLWHIFEKNDFVAYGDINSFIEIFTWDERQNCWNKFLFACVSVFLWLLITRNSSHICKFQVTKFPLSRKSLEVWYLERHIENKF